MSSFRMITARDACTRLNMWHPDDLAALPVHGAAPYAVNPKTDYGRKSSIVPPPPTRPSVAR